MENLKISEIKDIKDYIEMVDGIEYQDSKLVILVLQDADGEEYNEVNFTKMQELNFENYLKESEEIGGEFEDCIGLDSGGNPIYDTFKRPTSLEDWMYETEPYEQKIQLKYFLISEMDKIRINKSFDIFEAIGSYFKS